MRTHTRNCFFPLAQLICINSHRLLCTQDGNTALHMAAYQSHIPVVELLVNAGAPMNVQNKVRTNICYVVTIIQVIKKILGKLIRKVYRDGSDKQSTYMYRFHYSKHPTLSHITIPTYVAAV